MAELPLPSPFVSALNVAVDQVVDGVEAWMIEYREGETIKHPGRVTGKFLEQQAGMGPRSIIASAGGRVERISGGAETLLLTRFQWWLVVRGQIEDRTQDGLLFAGEGCRLVADPPWSRDDLVGSAFASPPKTDTIEWTPKYSDSDETRGLSIWVIEWEQMVELGTAQRAKTPAPVPLDIITGVSELEGDPNPDTLDTVVS